MSTARNLEIFSTTTGEKRGSLFELLNNCQTAMGSRLLRDHLTRPLMQITEIERRLNAVQFGVSNHDFTKYLTAKLSNICDIKRIIARLSTGGGQPRDLIALASTLMIAENIKSYCQTYVHLMPELLLGVFHEFPDHNALAQTLQHALNPDPLLNLRDGGVIRSGFHGQLDALRDFTNQGKNHINELELRYQKLYPKIAFRYKYNNLIGSFFECSSKNAPQVPTDLFIHRQSLTDAVRYTTLELQELDSRLSRNKEEVIALERELFDKLVTQALKSVATLNAIADAIAWLDIILNHARNAIDYNWTCPQLCDDYSLIIKGGRHPIIENSHKQQSHSQFTPNDTNLVNNQQMIILTGPNMAGKSTYLRQNAIVVLMAQMGSFVPATAAQIGIVDRIFCRVGASDDLASGKSTFMVEMTETATILHQATSSSLVIMDEMGRGTATFDGLSLAWATLEYLHDTKRPRTLFATHYHELAQLPQQYPAIKCMKMDVITDNQTIVFLHSISNGAAEHSYGLYVAKLAGLPSAVTNRALVILKQMESLQNYANQQPSLLPTNTKIAEQITPENPIISEINSINPNDLTPMQALSLINKWKSICS